MESLVRKDRITGKLQNYYNNDGIFMTAYKVPYLPIQLKIDGKWKFAYRCLTDKGIKTFTTELDRIMWYNLLTSYDMELSIRFKYQLSDVIIDNHISKHVYDTMTFEYDDIPCRVVNVSQVIFGGKYKNNTSYLKTQSILFSDDNRYVNLEPMHSMIIDRKIVNEYLDYYDCKKDLNRFTPIDSDYKKKYWMYTAIDRITSLIKEHYKDDQDLMNVKLLELLNKSDISDQRKYISETYSDIYYDYFTPMYNGKKLDNAFFETDSFDPDNPDDIMNLIYNVYKHSENNIDNILFDFNLYIMHGTFSMLNKIAKLPSYRDMSILRFVNKYKVAISFIIPDNED